MPSQAQQNLTGVWLGLFSYPRAIKAGHFDATLLETSHRLSGVTSEIWPRGPRAGESVLAILLGRRDGSSVHFSKTYEGPEKPNHTVKYEGTVTDDFLEIKGRWYIPGNWAGRFLMIRSGAQEIEIAQMAFEKAYL